MISQSVRSYLEDMSPDERGRMESLAFRLASPQARSNMRKVFHGTDLEVFGRERFAARFAGFTQNGIFHLCLAKWVSSHDDYERMFASKNRKDFQSKDEFMRMERPKEESLPADASPTTATWLELRKQRDELLQRCKVLDAENKQLLGNARRSR